MRRDDEHVGQKKVALDICCGCSPAVVGYVPVSWSARVVVEQVQSRFRAALDEFLPGHEWLLDRPIEVKLSRQTGYVLPRQERESQSDKKLAYIRGLFAMGDILRQEEIATNEHNGTLGWWKVSGVRHSAIVRADSAGAAIDRASDAVQAWESPSADWIGEELPEVLEV